MNRSFLMLLLPFWIFLPHFTFGQISSGTILIGGGINYNQNKNSINQSVIKNSNSSISPTTGYFVRENLALGVGLGLNMQKQKAGSNVTSKGFEDSSGPFCSLLQIYRGENCFNWSFRC